MKSKVEGAIELEQYFKKLPKKVEHAAIRALEHTAKAIETEAKTNCPVRTGYLRDSIKTEISNDKMSAIIGTDVFYAPFVEFGTSKMAAQPFLFPAVEHYRHVLAETIKKILGTS